MKDYKNFKKSEGEIGTPPLLHRNGVGPGVLGLARWLMVEALSEHVEEPKHLSEHLREFRLANINDAL